MRPVVKKTVETGERQNYKMNIEAVVLVTSHFNLTQILSISFGKIKKDVVARFEAHIIWLLKDKTTRIYQYPAAAIDQLNNHA